MDSLIGALLWSRRAALDVVIAGDGEDDRREAAAERWPVPENVISVDERD